MPQNLTTPEGSQLSASDIEHYSVSCGCEPRNDISNRYIDIEPYNRTRVIVGHWNDDEGEMREDPDDDRYINANWVRELFGGKWWIATQAPLARTTHAFLSLFLQTTTCPPARLHAASLSSPAHKSRIRTVVQLTRIFEEGRRKAHKYFPSTIGHSYDVQPEEGQTGPSLKVTLLDSRTIDEADCILSTVSILPLRSNAAEIEPVVFRHLLYEAWPDHGVPEREDRPSFLQFIRLVDRTNKDTSFAFKSQPANSDPDLDPDPPIIVNCSAGVGRTGAFIALSSLLRAHRRLSVTPGEASATQIDPVPGLPPSPLGPLPDEIKDDLVAQEIDSLREQRPSMVQRVEQIVFIYEVVAASFLR
jgi:protein tyrosine phosphatase